jgi:GxxExxY protein
MHENAISRIIVEAAIDVHRTLSGPGLLENVYEEAMAFEMASRGLTIARQLHVPIDYKGRILASPMKLDLLVNEKVIIEVKAVENYNRVFEAQALTYLRLTKLRLALVINFGESQVIKGVHRVVNGLTDDV